jgi:carboxyl-terminal processing protease
MAVGIVGMGLVVRASTLQAKPTVPAEHDDTYQELDLFADALKIVQTDYVEEPKAKDLMYGALKGMLSTLDPYSQFLDPDSYNELKVETEGEFGGLGIEITIKDDLLTIISPIDDTPAFRAGLLSGDRVVKIDGELTRGITLLDAVKKLRGKPGTTVKLTVLREEENTLKDITVERAVIKVQSVRDAKMMDDHIGYIRLSDFHENTTQDLSAAFMRLKEQEADSLILERRNNPGGLLDVAITVSELFLNRQQLIVTTKGRLRNQNTERYARADGPINDLPLVVLINEGSASASEIVAGAIQDHHRGVLMGAKSHGKASVQTIFPLKDGSALRLTTSKYFTPSGRSIHGTGISPDVEVPFERPPESGDKKKDEEGSEDIFDRIDGEKSGQPLTEGEPAGAAGEAATLESKKPERLDTQLARAVDLLKGIKVYQGREKGSP